MYVAGDVDFDPKVELEGGGFESAKNIGGGMDMGDGGIVMGPADGSGGEPPAGKTTKYR
jgi:hypothetical protein